MDEATKAQLIGQIEGLEQAKVLLQNRPTANACSIVPEIEAMMSALRGELLDAAGMRRLSDAKAEIERLREALLRAREQIVDQQAMPDVPTWIDDILTSANQ